MILLEFDVNFLYPSFPSIATVKANANGYNKKLYAVDNTIFDSIKKYYSNNNMNIHVKEEILNPSIQMNHNNQNITINKLYTIGNAT